MERYSYNCKEGRLFATNQNYGSVYLQCSVVKMLSLNSSRTVTVVSDFWYYQADVCSKKIYPMTYLRERSCSNKSIEEEKGSKSRTVKNLAIAHAKIRCWKQLGA